MQPQTQYLETLSEKSDLEEIFQQIHDTAYELTAIAMKTDAKFLGFLLMMVAEEAEHLAWASKTTSTGSIKTE